MTTALKTKVNQQDLKIYPSERLTQTDDAGGMPLGKPLTGALNELFQPISSIARVNGAFYAVLEYMGVLRADNEPLIGPFAAITKPPSDPTVSYLMFKATRFGESRAEALSRIEAYNIATIESNMTLLSTQSAGSRIVQAYLPVDGSLPMIGDIYCLQQKQSGYQQAEQYIQVTRIVKTEIRSFINANNTVFNHMVVQFEIGSKLKTDFIGVNYPSDRYVDNPCKILETGVADAAQYFGVKPLAKAISKDSVTLQTTGIMEKIVPVNQLENPLVDINPSKMSITVDSGYDAPNNVKISVPVQTYKEDIIANVRSYNYTAQLISPKLGTVTAEYMAQGKWYKLIDDGTGKLVGASLSHGSGFLNKTTGSLVLSVGNLPDVNSAIIISYAKDVYKKPTLDAEGYLPITLDNHGVEITVTSNGKTGTLSDNVLSGDITGIYDKAGKTLKIYPTVALTDVTVTYKVPVSSMLNESVSPVVGDANITFTLKNSPVTPRFINFTAIYQGFSAIECRIFDDGQGALVADITRVPDVLGVNGVYVGQQTIGSINYTTGTVSLKKIITINETKDIVERVKVGTKREVTGSGSSATIEVTDVMEQQVIGQRVFATDYQFREIVVSYAATTDTQSVSKTYPKPPLYLDLKQQNIVANTLTFNIGTTPYVEKDGKIYQGTAEVGTLVNGLAILTNYVNGAVSVKTLLVKTGDDRTNRLSFTTPKMRPASLKLNIDDKQAAAKIDGNIVMENTAVGFVDSSVGLVMIDRLSTQFDNLIYQLVALSYLPIDTAIAKIDAVRLPQDGLIPIFRRGDSILIRNAQTDNLGSAFTGGQTINLSRADVDRISLLDADNKPVLGDLWDYDLDAGTITFKTSIDLSSYKMPLKAIHAQEQRNRIVDLDIDGTLSLLFATNRNYPIENTYVSSLLIGDDLAVRVSVPFTQRSWNNVWQDTPVGDQLLNKLKLTDYPVILTDDGAITDRWMIKFISNAQFELYSEALGFVGKFDTLNNLAPINPATNKPYFTIDKRAFGTDTPWAVQDVIRFNTWGTLMPVWVLCAVQPNPNPPTGADGFEQYLFGDTTEVTA